ncbi:F-box/WD repeat-containing protein 7-like protein [Lates japonicus]|uniref:F-box/WD repeat-containing protein 7-like protein n=1 Tax=Lates japonicus TaxID=270547 RepID=A0AAD3NKN3_LATJO|nr:F-box/WD repeat-containing protein 7-like protein [Lates japonicus]
MVQIVAVPFREKHCKGNGYLQLQRPCCRPLRPADTEILAEDSLLWRRSGVKKVSTTKYSISECVSSRRRKCARPGAAVSPSKSAYIRQHRIENNWRKGDTREPMVLKGHDDHVITCLQFSGDLIVSGSDDNTLQVWSAITGKCLRSQVTLVGGAVRWRSPTMISSRTGHKPARCREAEVCPRCADCVHCALRHLHDVLSSHFLSVSDTHSSNTCSIVSHDNHKRFVYSYCTPLLPRACTDYPSS